MRTKRRHQTQTEKPRRRKRRQTTENPTTIVERPAEQQIVEKQQVRFSDAQPARQRSVNKRRRGKSAENSRSRAVYEKRGDSPLRTSNALQTTAASSKYMMSSTTGFQ